MGKILKGEARIWALFIGFFWGFLVKVGPTEPGQLRQTGPDRAEGFIINPCGCIVS